MELGFGGIWELFAFFMWTDSQTSLEYHSDSNFSNLDDLKTNLRHTIATYEEKLATATSDIEKRVIESTIKSMKEQLNKLLQKLKNTNSKE